MDSVIQHAVRELLRLYNFISVAELAERIGVSESSLKHRMNILRELLAEYDVKLEQLTGKGIRLEASEQQREELRSYLYEVSYNTSESDVYRKNYILKTLFEYQVNYTIQLFADELFVSRSQIVRDLDELASFLEPYRVKIVKKRNSGIRLCGNEFAIREAIIGHYNSVWWNDSYINAPEECDVRISNKVWTYMTKMYGDVDLLNVMEKLRQAEEMTGSVYTDVAFGRLFEYIAVSIRRIKINKRITDYHDKNLLPLEDKYIEAAGYIFSDYMQENLPEQEIRYLAAYLYVSETVTPRILRNYKKDRIVRYLRNVIKTIDGSEFSGDETLVNTLSDYIIRAEYKENYHIKVWNDINREIKKNLSELYAVCLGQIFILESESVKFEPDDIASIAMIIDSYMQKRKKETVFVTAANNVTTQYQLERLKKIFPEYHFIGAVHYKDFKPEQYAGKQIISTVRLPEEIPYIKITKHVDEKDIHVIGEKSLSRSKHQQEVFGNFDNIELIWDLKAKDKEDALAKICDYLKEAGYVTDAFQEAVFEREKKTPTSVGGSMAVPHVFETGIQKTCLVIAKLKNAVLWETYDLVDLVFLFALKDSEIGIAELFAGVYRLISDKEMVARMRSSKEELWEIVKR